MEVGRQVEAKIEFQMGLSKPIIFTKSRAVFGGHHQFEPVKPGF
jgi:hypothetical protein